MLNHTRLGAFSPCFRRPTTPSTRHLDGVRHHAVNRDENVCFNVRLNISALNEHPLSTPLLERTLKHTLERRISHPMNGSLEQISAHVRTYVQMWITN
jgi:hypothetical protein